MKLFTALSRRLPFGLRRHRVGDDSGTIAAKPLREPYPTPRPPRDRVMIVGQVLMSVLTLAMVGLLGRVVQIQIQPAPQLAQLLDTQYSSTPLYATRGQLTDRLGRDLTVSGTRRRLFVDPKMIQDPGTYSERVGYALGYNPAIIEQAINARSHSRFVVLDEDLADWRLARMREARLPALGIETRLERHYPLGSTAGQLLGFVGFDGVGLEGLERAFNSQLAGKPGKIAYLRDSAKRPLWIDGARLEMPVDGQSVRLSLDVTIQAIAEAELRAAVEQYHAKAAQLIVMDPYTGEVLAMANYPGFDPSDINATTPDQRRNRCITDQFEPGSIFKPIVWAAATQMGIARPQEHISGEGGLWITASRRRLHDAHGHGMLTWEGGLIKSSNIVMGKVGERMGNQRLHRAVTAFGFGSPTGIGLEGEAAGLVNPLGRWSGYSSTSLPMGHEIAVTPLQMVRSYCTFANGGFLIRPRILAVDSAADLAGSQVIGRVLTPAIAYETRSVMRKVVTEGTGRKALSDQYTIWGKTGTAQIPDPQRRGYIPQAYVGSFVAGAPLERPRIIVGLFIHHPDPRKGHYGGIIAAPGVKNVIDKTLQYLGVPPDVIDGSPDAEAAAARFDARE